MNLQLPDLPEDPARLELHLLKEEQRAGGLRPGAGARIVWADPDRKHKTGVSLVYLHGFSASQGEGYPVHEEFARRYGLNLYLSRLAGHGLKDSDVFVGLTPQKLLDSAAKAVAAGQRLGKEVIIMATSTGASLGLYISSLLNNPSFLRGLILYSPLIDFHGIASPLLTNRWTRRLLNIIPGKAFRLRSDTDIPGVADIWYSRYRLEGALALGELIERTMTPHTFSEITLPVFTGYYFKNRAEQDEVVSVAEILKMHERLSTDSMKKRIVNFPEAGSHVICSSLLSGSVNAVKKETFLFSEEVLGLNPV